MRACRRSAGRVKGVSVKALSINQIAAIGVYVGEYAQAQSRYDAILASTGGKVTYSPEEDEARNALMAAGRALNTCLHEMTHVGPRP